LAIYIYIYEGFAVTQLWGQKRIGL